MTMMFRSPSLSFAGAARLYNILIEFRYEIHVKENIKICTHFYARSAFALPFIIVIINSPRNSTSLFCLLLPIRINYSVCCFCVSKFSISSLLTPFLNSSQTPQTRSPSLSSPRSSSPRSVFSPPFSPSAVSLRRSV